MRLPFAVLALFAGGCFFGYRNDAVPNAPRVHRGTFVNDMVLTGELNAASGSAIAMPRLPSWQTSIKWIAVDGSEIKQGEPVVELDNGPFASNLDAKKQAVVQAEQQLAQKQAEWSADTAQKELDAERKRVDLDKAKLDAAVPKEVLSLREFEDRQTKFKRATVEFEKARDLLRAQKAGARAEEANLQVALDRARRELQEAEDAIVALTLRAPRGGLVVIRDHPWEGRKFQVGDPAWVGMPLALIPEPSSLRIEAALADVDDGRVRVGMPARVILDAYPATTYTGRVTEISAVAQESARASMRRAFRVIVKLDKIDPARMRPGLSARVMIRRDERPNAMLISRADIAGRNGLKLGPCNAQECVVMP
ncbi:MAG TPA: HlyD family efflux transporter periplasmic adaptor subunit [Thermoanaerobaculia bacterium]|nr:HlyD family efflux transporter periplasmic adaptor subunit [Thermoanaerobaculia bacterium]